MNQLSRRAVLTTTALAAVATPLSFAPAQAAVAAEPAREFLTRNSFVIAHRGAGNLNPEHTIESYTASVAQGAQAVEISVRMTADQQLVCFHDATTTRTMNLAGAHVRTSTLDTLRQHKIDMREFLGSGTPLADVCTLEQALDAIAAVPSAPGIVGGQRVILFIEAKDTAAQEPLLRILEQRGLRGRVVLKMFRNGSSGFNPERGFVRRAHQAGYPTWCFFDVSDSLESIARMAQGSTVDALGLPYFEKITGRTASSVSDETISAVVAMGKPVIMWEIHRRSAMDYFATLGVRGFMAPDPRWLTGWGTPADLKLEAGRRITGVLPSEQQRAENMPQYSNGMLINHQPYDESVLLGPLAHMASVRDYVINFSMRWLDTLPSSTWSYGYLAFGRADDSAFGIGREYVRHANAGCYVLAIRPGAVARDEFGRIQRGDLIQLLRFDPDRAEPVVLYTLRPRTAFSANQDINGKIIVRAGSITVDVAGSRSEPVTDQTYRGAYSHFGRYHSLADGGPFALHSVKAYNI